MGTGLIYPMQNITFLSGKNNASTDSLLWDHQLKNNNKEQPHSHAVYKLLQSLPICQDKSYPRTPLWSPQEFLRLYHEQIAVEQKIDGAPEENSGHRRRALHAIVAKAYRGNGKIYNFIKSKIALYEQAPIHQADRHALLKWLQENPDCRLSTVKKDFLDVGSFLSCRCAQND